ncbi:MAG: GMC family oxidoreductase [Desulfobacterales bacterium]|nr:GMC family oxidoreductase [Desulfobacterales bacterium]
MEQLSKQRFDAIVVGSGPGGATVAKELTHKKLKVLILEEGSNAPITGSPIQTIQIAGIPGKNVLFTPELLSMVRATVTGGSSIIYYGTAFDPPVQMFAQYGIDIHNEVEEIRTELPIAPLRDDLIGPMAKRIMESAKSLGYAWDKLPKFIYQDKCRQDCWRCNYGCPYGAKWNARMYVEEAVSNGAVLVNGVKVQDVLFEKKQARGVAFTRWGIEDKAYAPIVILAAGGIGTPVILRASGIKNAGYQFFFDPLISVMGTANDIDGGQEVPMATGIHLKEDGYLMTDMTIPHLLYKLFAAQVFRFDRLFSHRKTLTIMIKIKDDLGGRLTDSGGVRKQLTQEDLKKLHSGYDRAREILTRAGATNIFKSWYIAAHPGGTAKVNDIVDTHLQTEYHNLYVCDCSVIPEPWGLPPTFTLIALAKRLAKHLIH